MLSARSSSSLHAMNLIIFIHWNYRKSNSSIRERSMNDVAFAASRSSYQIMQVETICFSSQPVLISCHFRIQARCCLYLSFSQLGRSSQYNVCFRKEHPKSTRLPSSFCRYTDVSKNREVGKGLQRASRFSHKTRKGPITRYSVFQWKKNDCFSKFNFWDVNIKTLVWIIS